MNERRSKTPSSSSATCLDVLLFACGHGDTILVRLPNDEWALVDCHLPQAGGVRDRFFELIDELQISRLAFVFQTHPDYDHYLGMLDVLTHFIETDGKSVGTFLDSGLSVQQMKRLLVESQRPGRDEYRRLQVALRQWDRDGKLDWRELDAERPPIPIGTPVSANGELVPIAPCPKAKRRLIEAELQRYGDNPQTTLDANRLSLVLALLVDSPKMKLNVLLAADADSEGLSRAVELWRQHAHERGVPSNFDAIKVSHHGSHKNRCGAVVSLRAANRPASICAVSAGTRFALPDRRVLQGCLDAGWTVMCTTTRHSSDPSLPAQPAPGDRPVALHLKPLLGTRCEEHTIRLSWDDAGNFHFGPDEAVINTSHLTAYDVAST